MPGLKYYASNRLEVLVGQLAEVTSTPLGSPLAKEIILVQSRGMARWVSLQLAQITDICMNCEFPFPRGFIAGILKEFFPEADLEKEFTAEAMTWRINSLLPELVGREAFATVLTYLADDDGLKRFQLSQKVANLFDQYLVYRPEMLMRWQRNEVESNRKETGWQAELWKALIGKNDPLHLGMINERLERQMLSASRNLPERISIFGISSLPPLHLRVLFSLARHCEVHMFEVNPSQEYYGQDISPKYLAKLVKGFSQAQREQFARQTGNPLLSSLGKLNRDSIEVRLELDERMDSVVQEQPTQFIDPEGSRMLDLIQSDLLHARGAVEGAEKRPITADDHSVRIHSCHSPVRELEVLYDQLLELFESDPSLKPRDILVMAPDIDRYAPFIEAVFGFPEEAARKIPFSVADRRPTSSSPVIETFLALLALPGSRFTAPEILSLLDRKSVRERFGFEDQEIQLIQQWIAGANIRWGIDGAHRSELDLPDLEANTWRAGIKRLLLGYAMAGANCTLFENIMPYDEIEGGSSEVLGRFITAVEALFDVATGLSKERKASEWAGQFEALIEQFFPPDADGPSRFGGPGGSGGLQEIRVALDQLRQIAGDPLVGFHIIRYYLSQLLDQSEQRGGFLTGCVTFCALQPMRSIPSRVIALIGMGDQNFPRPTQTPGFDLMACERKCGDRSPREDDRYTFLEAILSARDRLYLSYVGHSIVDNAEIPPSVLVSELIDYIANGFEFPSGRTAPEFLLTEHRLHAFSPRYFDGQHPGLFSYSLANARAAEAARIASPVRMTSPDFFGKAIPPPDQEMRRVGLRSLIEFFANPSKYFIRRRLGMRFEHDDEIFLDVEPFNLGSLESYGIKQELVSHGLARRNFGADELAARGLLPLGEIGKATFQSYKRQADTFRKQVELELGGETPPEPLLIDIPIDDFRITGEIDSLYGVRKIQFRCAKLKPKDQLNAWITHLALCAVGSPDTCQTVLIGSDETVRFGPVQNARELLAKLLAIYWKGLERPLPFFPASALEYATVVSAPDGDPKNAALGKAGQKWNGSDYTGGGEKNDENFAFCFEVRTGLEKRDPLDGEFEGLAMEVFGPMLLARAKTQ